MDVSHGSPGQSDVPSIAAVVSSRQWPRISRYRASVQTQPARVEMIENLFKPLQENRDEGIIRELLIDFYASSAKRKPEQIIIFRDGVGESQFNQVLNIELDRIIEVKSELPSTFKAYRFQQHRWSCGPANLFRKMLCDIIKAKRVSPWKKFYVIYSFFLARRIVSHFVTFFFYCVLIPLSVFFPEVEIPKWGMIYIPSVITIFNAVGTPSSFHLIIFWVLFENVMSLHRCKAVIIGLLEAGRANEWIVTEKLGDMLKAKPTINIAKKVRIKFWERFHFLELGLAAYLTICACYDYYFLKDYYFIFLIPQSIAFIIMGCGYIGTIFPNGK